jgi:hypothetical protein
VLRPIISTVIVAPRPPVAGVRLNAGTTTLNDKVLLLTYGPPLTLMAYTPDTTPTGTVKEIERPILVPGAVAGIRTADPICGVRVTVSGGDATPC